MFETFWGKNVLMKLNISPFLNKLKIKNTFRKNRRKGLNVIAHLVVRHRLALKYKKAKVLIQTFNVGAIEM